MKELDKPTSSTKKDTGWGQNRRLEFIDFRLLWEGRINRSDLTNFFGISIPQASLDLARYQEMVPDNVNYDRSEKVYLATSNFEPFFTSQDSSQFLNSLLAVNLEMMGREMSFIGWYPDFGAVLSPNRKIDAKILFRVLKAMREHLALEVEYQSLNRPEPTVRTISPHAIAYDGFRWHMRAYCHEHEDFRDFVFARVLNIRTETPSSIDPHQDAGWSMQLKLVLAPNPALPPAQRRAIELDYDMKNGNTIIQTRQALLFYLLRRLGLHEKTEISAQAQQIVLVNESELLPFLTK